MKKILLYIGIALLLLAVAFLLGRREGRNEAISATQTKTDTLYVRDTIREIRPISRNVKVVDTIYVKADTVRVKDTLFVELPMEQKVYEDSLYRAVVSGFRPSLDTISIYGTTRIITQSVSVPPSRWGYGFSLGPSLGIGIDGKAIIGLSVSFGIQYRNGNL